MKKLLHAILLSEALSYGLIIVFLFADAMFNLTGIFRTDRVVLSPQFAYIGACLVGIVGCINVWLTWHYMQKSDAMRDWLVICAWTHRIKRDGRWLTLEEFLSEHLGYRVSHGLSDPRLVDMREELDTKWRQFPPPAIGPASARPEAAATDAKDSTTA